jgi:ubiquinone/menaquinone biosynthesis C-methylase UbiE
MQSDLLAAAKTWNAEEPLEYTNARIHDGVNGEDALRLRADWYVKDLIFGKFPQALPHAGANILEIGSGVGWIMQAMNDYLCGLGLPPERIIGLDIAENMLTKARTRLGDKAPFAYQLYDGVNIPLETHSVDLVYSTACLQHIPRPFVFNLFFEVQRLLKNRGFGIFHFLSTAELAVSPDAAARQEQRIRWYNEIRTQILGLETHWHHYYTVKELYDVLRITGFPSVAIDDTTHDGSCIIACVSNNLSD